MDMKEYYEKDVVKKCDVCSHIVMVDQYGNGKCDHCGWIQGKDEEEFERANKISYPNLVPLSRAREQYKQGKPFKATFEDFVNGLFFYSEMLFRRKGEMFEVYLKGDSDKFNILFGNTRVRQEFKTREDFINSANIDGKLLKEIWDEEVEWSGFMYCG